MCSPSLSMCTGHASLGIVSTSTTSFRLCTVTQRYFLLRDGIPVLPADEEEESGGGGGFSVIGYHA